MGLNKPFLNGTVKAVNLYITISGIDDHLLALWSYTSKCLYLRRHLDPSETSTGYSSTRQKLFPQ